MDKKNLTIVATCIGTAVLAQEYWKLRSDFKLLFKHANKMRDLLDGLVQNHMDRTFEEIIENYED